MLKNIEVKYDVIEMMQFYWESVADKQKMPDSYLNDIADKEDMHVLYNDDFDKDSVRKVLSAIMNSELLNGASKAESRFWNYNMWMLEDLDFMRAMIQPVKQLNIDELYDEFKEDSKFEDLKVAFIPGHLEKEYVEDGNLYINFFNLKADFMDPSHVTLEGKEVKDYVLTRAREILSK